MRNFKIYLVDGRSLTIFAETKGQIKRIILQRFPEISLIDIARIEEIKNIWFFIKIII